MTTEKKTFDEYKSEVDALFMEGDRLIDDGNGTVEFRNSCNCLLSSYDFSGGVVTYL